MPKTPSKTTARASATDKDYVVKLGYSPLQILSALIIGNLARVMGVGMKTYAVNGQDREKDKPVGYASQFQTDFHILAELRDPEQFTLIGRRAHAELVSLMTTNIDAVGNQKGNIGTKEGLALVLDPDWGDVGIPDYRNEFSHDYATTGINYLFFGDQAVPPPFPLLLTDKHSLYFLRALTKGALPNCGQWLIEQDDVLWEQVAKELQQTVAEAKSGGLQDYCATVSQQAHLLLRNYSDTAIQKMSLPPALQTLLQAAQDHYCRALPANNYGLNPDKTSTVLPLIDNWLPEKDEYNLNFDLAFKDIPEKKMREACYLMQQLTPERLREQVDNACDALPAGTLDDTRRQLVVDTLSTRIRILTAHLPPTNLSPKKKKILEETFRTNHAKVLAQKTKSIGLDTHAGPLRKAKLGPNTRAPRVYEKKHSLSMLLQRIQQLNKQAPNRTKQARLQVALKWLLFSSTNKQLSDQARLDTTTQKWLTDLLSKQINETVRLLNSHKSRAPRGYSLHSDLARAMQSLQHATSHLVAKRGLLRVLLKHQSGTKKLFASIAALYAELIQHLWENTKTQQDRNGSIPVVFTQISSEFATVVTQATQVALALKAVDISTKIDCYLHKLTNDVTSALMTLLAVVTNPLQNDATKQKGLLSLSDYITLLSGLAQSLNPESKALIKTCLINIKNSFKGWTKQPNFSLNITNLAWLTPLPSLIRHVFQDSPTDGTIMEQEFLAQLEPLIKHFYSHCPKVAQGHATSRTLRQLTQHFTGYLTFLEDLGDWHLPHGVIESSYLVSLIDEARADYLEQALSLYQQTTTHRQDAILQMMDVLTLFNDFQVYSEKQALQISDSLNLSNSGNHVLSMFLQDYLKYATESAPRFKCLNKDKLGELANLMSYSDFDATDKATIAAALIEAAQYFLTEQLDGKLYNSNQLSNHLQVAHGLMVNLAVHDQATLRDSYGTILPLITRLGNAIESLKWQTGQPAMQADRFGFDDELGLPLDEQLIPLHESNIMLGHFIASVSLFFPQLPQQLASAYLGNARQIVAEQKFPRYSHWLASTSGSAMSLVSSSNSSLASCDRMSFGSGSSSSSSSPLSATSAGLPLPISVIETLQEAIARLSPFITTYLIMPEITDETDLSATSKLFSQAIVSALCEKFQELVIDYLDAPQQMHEEAFEDFLAEFCQTLPVEPAPKSRLILEVLYEQCESILNAFSETDFASKPPVEKQAESRQLRRAFTLASLIRNNIDCLKETFPPLEFIQNELMPYFNFVNESPTELLAHKGPVPKLVHHQAATATMTLENNNCLKTTSSTDGAEEEAEFGFGISP